MFALHRVHVVQPGLHEGIKRLENERLADVLVAALVPADDRLEEGAGAAGVAALRRAELLAASVEGVLDADLVAVAAPAPA